MHDAMCTQTVLYLWHRRTLFKVTAASHHTDVYFEGMHSAMCTCVHAGL